MDVEVEVPRGSGAGEAAGEALLHLGAPVAGTLCQPAGALGQGDGPGRGDGLGRGHQRRRLFGAGQPSLGRSGGAQAVVVRGHGLACRLAHVPPQVESVSDLDRVRAPSRMPSAYAPARSRHTTFTPGCSRSQAASVPDSRPGSTSTGL